MKLKHQLLLLALLSVIFPVSGWLALKSIDDEFRAGIEQASKNTLISIKSSVQQLMAQKNDLRFDGFVPTIIEEGLLDGDDAEWQAVKPYIYRQGDQQLSMRVGQYQEKLALYVQSNDASFDGQSPGGNNNDHVIVAVADDRGLYQYQFNRQAEGKLMSDTDQQGKPAFEGYWHEISQGYTLELWIDGADIHHLGVAMIDASLMQRPVGTLVPDSSQRIQLEPLLTVKPVLTDMINSITPPDHHFIIQDLEGRVINQSNKLPANDDQSGWQWIITPLYHWIFSVDTSTQQWFERADGISGVQHSIEEGDAVYVLKTVLPKGQQNMITALLKTTVVMVAVMLLLMLAYLLYALFLAWRIKKLNQAMQTVLDDSGQVNTHMPSRLATDEIGQLARGIESMLTEMSEYTQYLKDLGSRLSHEMKTPLAIVQSSLDNLAHEPDEAFLQRAQQGTQRLRFILNQLSELSRLKYALQQTPLQVVDLAELVGQLGAAYQAFIPHLRTVVDEPTLLVNGSSDLIAQMIDKLIDNAKSFTPVEGHIEIRVSRHNKKVVLSVFNSGSQLPKGHQPRIFDSLVSLRSQKNTDTAHLGLGLYLVRLIGRYHQAQVEAENTSDQTGVVFTVAFEALKTV